MMKSVGQHFLSCLCELPANTRNQVRALQNERRANFGTRTKKASNRRIEGILVNQSLISGLLLAGERCCNELGFPVESVSGPETWSSPAGRGGSLREVTEIAHWGWLSAKGKTCSWLCSPMRRRISLKR